MLPFIDIVTEGIYGHSRHSSPCGPSFERYHELDSDDDDENICSHDNEYYEENDASDNQPSMLLTQNIDVDASESDTIQQTQQH